MRKVPRFDDRSLHTRRQLIQRLGLAAGALVSVPLKARPSIAQTTFSTTPFTLGVASGEPLPDGFVIWTRLVPKPFEIGYGMDTTGFPVDWEVASDEGFRSVVRSGQVIASPFLAHAVHVEVSGLQPDRPYWYRFRAGGVESPAGRSRTTPAFGASINRVRFAVAGCQHYESGLYTAYRHLAAENPDFVFCYGDYIYENGGRPAPEGTAPALAARRHTTGEILSVDDYRRRYAQYKMDADLQTAHAAAPWFVTWDDHETDNNWAADIDEKGTDPALFLLRRQAAAQAYYEHMPLRRSSLPYGPHIQLYRQALYGDLINLNLLDTRQYRSNQPCEDRNAGCTDLSSAPNMLGGEQEAWLKQSLSRSRARWNVLAQQVMMMDLDRDPSEAFRANVDSWAGYRLPRTRLLEHVRDNTIRNVVVLTGDEHVNYAGELHIDGMSPGPKPLAVEFVATSISSSGDGQDASETAKGVLSVNPQLKFINQQRGYIACDVTPERWETSFRVMDKVSAPGGAISTRAKMAVAAGSNGLVAA